MNSWYPIVLLVLAGFLIGGVYSFAKAKRYPAAVILGIAAALSLLGALLWFQQS